MKLFQRWGYDGFLQHTAKTAAFYEMKRDQCLEAAAKNLKGLYRIPFLPEISLCSLMRLNSGLGVSSIAR